MAYKLEVTRKKNFLRRGGTLNVSSTHYLPSSQTDAAIIIARFAENFFSHPSELLRRATTPKQELLSDLRGRPADAFRNVGEQTPIDLRAELEELFFARGIIEEKATFSCRIHSRFDSFKESHIEFQRLPGATAVVQEILPDLSPRLLSRLIPARLEEIRLGLECFRPLSFGHQWSGVPDVVRRFYLSIRNAELKIFAEETYSGKNPQLPFQDEQLLTFADEALRRCGLATDFLEAVQKQI